MATITERLTAVEAQLAAVRTTLDELVLASREMSVAIVIGEARRLKDIPAPKKKPRPDHLRLVRSTRVQLPALEDPA